MLRRYLLIGLSLLAISWQLTAVAKSSEDQLLKFTVVAFSQDASIRRDFENELVKALREDNYDAIVSHSLVEKLSDFSEPNIYTTLREEGVQGILLLMPVDVGSDASIKSIQQRTGATTYHSIESFVNDYRGGNFGTQAVVQVSAFLISGQQASNFWQGVVWLDDTVTTREEGIKKLSGLVLYNLNASRAYLRKLLGLEPLRGLETLE